MWVQVNAVVLMNLYFIRLKLALTEARLDSNPVFGQLQSSVMGRGRRSAVQWSRVASNFSRWSRRAGLMPDRSHLTVWELLSLHQMILALLISCPSSHDSWCFTGLYHPLVLLARVHTHVYIYIYTYISIYIYIYTYIYIYRYGHMTRPTKLHSQRLESTL